MTTRSARQPRSRLTPQDWIEAGIELLTEAGVGAVKVESLAAELGVTRGSFYHHFADREALLQAMLDHWARIFTFDIAAQIGNLGLDPGTTLLAMLRLIRSQRLAEKDAPFRAWALHDPMARAVLERVDEVRLGTIRSQFEGLGFSGMDAENRARLFLYYEITAPAFFAQPAPELADELLTERHRLLTARDPS